MASTLEPGDIVRHSRQYVHTVVPPEIFAKLHFIDNHAWEQYMMTLTGAELAPSVVWRGDDNHFFEVLKAGTTEWVPYDS